MASQFPVSVRVGAALDGSVAAAFGGAQRHLTRLGDALRDVKAKSGDVGRLGQMRNRMTGLMETWRRAADARKAFEAAMSGSSATAQQTQRLERLREAEQRAGLAYRELQRDVSALDADLRRQGVDTGRLVAEQGRLGVEVGKLTRSYAGLGKAMAEVAGIRAKRSELRGQMVDAVALGGALYGLTKPAIEFESALSDIDKVVDFQAGAAGLKAMGAELQHMSRTIPQSQKDLAAIAAAGGRMGIGEKDILTYTETVAKMASAWEMPAEAAGEAAAKIQNVMGFSMAELMRVGDAINTLDDSSAAKAPEILEVIKRVSGTGKQFGLNTQQIAALGTTMLDLGRPTEVAATGINAMLVKLQAAPIQSKKFKAALKEMGWSATGMQNAIKKDAVGTLDKFLSKVATLDQNKRVNVLGEMFGMEYSDDLAILVGGLDKYRKYMGLVADETKYAGSVQKEFEKRSKTTANQIRLLANAGTEARTNLGAALLPALNRIVGATLPATHALADFADAHPAVTTAVVGTVGALVALKASFIVGSYVATFGQELLAVGKVAVEVARGARVLALTTALVAPVMNVASVATGIFGAALMATPIGWIAAGVAALAAAGVLIYKYWEPITTWLGGVWDGVVGALGSAVQHITGSMAPLAPVFDAVGQAFNWVGSAIGSVVDWFSSLFTPVKLTADGFQAVHDQGAAVGDVIGRVLVAAFGLISAPTRAAAAAVTWAWETIKSEIDWDAGAAISGVWEGAKAKIGEAVKTAEGLVGQAWDAIVAKVGWDPVPTITRLWTGIGEIFKVAWQSVMDYVQPAVDWIKSKIDWAKSAASWLTLGAFDSTPTPATEAAPKLGAAVNDNRGAPFGSPAKSVGATVSGGGTGQTAGDLALVPAPLPAPPSALKPGSAVNDNRGAPFGSPVKPVGAAVSAGGTGQTAGNLALAPAPPPAPRPTPTPAPITVTINMPIQIQIPSAELAEEIRKQAVAAGRTAVGAIEREMRLRSDSANYDH